MLGWVSRWISALRARVHNRGKLLLELLVLRHQLLVLQRTGTRRPCFRPSERLFWVFLSRWWANWQRSLIIVQPGTVLRWRRRGLRAIWLSGSRGRWHGGRPRISSEVPCAYLPNEPRQFLMGRAADSWRTAQTRIRRIAGHGVALHAMVELSAPPALAHLLAQPSARAW
jgi:hypothetical protein